MKAATKIKVKGGWVDVTCPSCNNLQFRTVGGIVQLRYVIQCPKCFTKIKILPAQIGMEGEKKEPA